MNSILDLPSIRARVSRISVDEYHRQAEYHENGKRTELIRGIGRREEEQVPRHEATVKRLFRLIWEAANRSHLVSKESPLTLHESEPEPDLSVVECREDDLIFAGTDMLHCQSVPAVQVPLAEVFAGL